MFSRSLLTRIRVAAVSVFVAAGFVSVSASEPLGAYSRYRLILKGAGESGEDLVLNFHARGEQLKTGWATIGPSAAFLPGHVLQRRDARLEGRVTTDIGPLEYDYAVTARIRGTELLGSYAGGHGISGVADRVSGQVAGRLAAPAAGGDLFVRLRLASMYTRHGHIRHPYVEAMVRGGKIVGGKFAFRGKGAGDFTSAKVDGGELTVREGRLAGTVRGTVVAGDASHGDYRFSIDLQVNTNFVRGEYHTHKDGNDWGHHGVSGTVWGLGKPQDVAVLELTLDRGIAAERPLTLLVRRQKERFSAGIAVGGNRALHSAEPVDLRIDQGKVSGSVKVTIRPEGSFPPGGRTVSCAYEIRAEVQGDGEAVGTFSGYYGRRHEKSGSLTGRILSTEQLWREFYGRSGNRRSQ